MNGEDEEIYRETKKDEEIYRERARERQSLIFPGMMIFFSRLYQDMSDAKARF